MAGVRVQFLETTSAKLKSLPFVDGRFIFCTDTGAFYRDTATKRFLLSMIGSVMKLTLDTTKTKLTVQTNIPMTVSANCFVINTTNTGVVVRTKTNAKDLNSLVEFIPTV